MAKHMKEMKKGNAWILINKNQTTIIFTSMYILPLFILKMSTHVETFLGWNIF